MSLSHQSLLVSELISSEVLLVKVASTIVCPFIFRVTTCQGQKGKWSGRVKNMT